MASAPEARLENQEKPWQTDQKNGSAVPSRARLPGSRRISSFGCTVGADQKSRGFHIHKSHISNVQRLSRLLIAACLAYIWIVYLGTVCEKDGWRPVMHRSKRCD